LSWGAAQVVKCLPKAGGPEYHQKKKINFQVNLSPIKNSAKFAVNLGKLILHYMNDENRKPN
jgi:hypothetical protein